MAKSVVVEVNEATKNVLQMFEQSILQGTGQSISDQLLRIRDELEQLSGNQSSPNTQLAKRLDGLEDEMKGLKHQLDSIDRKQSQILLFLNELFLMQSEEKGGK